MDKSKKEVKLPNLDITRELKEYPEIYLGDSIEYYGMDTHTIMLSMLNKVNKIFSNLEVKTLSQLKSALLRRYGNEGLAILGNVEILNQYVELGEIEVYKEMIECINDKFSYNLEISLKDIITYYIDQTGCVVDRLLMSYKNADGEPNVYVGRTHRSFMYIDKPVDKNQQLANELYTKFQRLLDIVSDEVNDTPVIVEIDYDSKANNVNCVLKYRKNFKEEELKDDRVQIEWIEGLKAKYNLK